MKDFKIMISQIKKLLEQVAAPAREYFPVPQERQEVEPAAA